MPAPVPAYIYKATFVSAHDGDTYILRLDFGKFAGVKPLADVKIRLRNWLCPELKETGGPEARDAAIAILSEATALTLIVQTHGPSFERTVGDVWVNDQSMGELLQKAGHARPRN